MVQNAAEKYLVLTREAMDDFLQWQKAQHRSEVTMDRYGRDPRDLYSWLPEDKELTAARLKQWKEAMVDEGYASRTVNSRMSAVNSFLAFEGRRDLQNLDFEKTEKQGNRLTRDEYLKLLQAAKMRKNRRLYLLIKVLGQTGIPVQNLSGLTVEAVRQGCVRSGNDFWFLPEELAEELSDYGKEKGILSGPLFITRNGNPLNRTTVTCMMKPLSAETRIDAERISPRCLKAMYQETWEEIQRSMEEQMKKTYTQLLCREEQRVAWAEGEEEAI